MKSDETSTPQAPARIPFAPKGITAIKLKKLPKRSSPMKRKSSDGLLKTGCFGSPRHLNEAYFKSPGKIDEGSNTLESWGSNLLTEMSFKQKPPPVTTDKKKVTAKCPLPINPHKRTPQPIPNKAQQVRRTKTLFEMEPVIDVNVESQKFDG